MKAIRVSAQVTLSVICGRPQRKSASPKYNPHAEIHAPEAWDPYQSFPTGADIIVAGTDTGARLAPGRQTSGDRACFSFPTSGITHTRDGGLPAVGVKPLRLIANREI